MPLSVKKAHKVNSLIHKGHRYHQQGEIIKAASEFNKALKIQANNFDALQGLGAIQLQKKDYPQAIRYLTKASTVNADVPGLQCNLGLAYQHTNNYDAAITCFTRAIELDPEFGAAYFNLALCQLDNGSYHEALTTLEKSERCRPGHLGTLEQMAYVLNQFGRHDEAINYFKHALQIEPDNTALLFSLGKTFQSSRQYLKALDTYEKVLQLKNTHHEVRAKLADLLESMNRLDEAAQHAEDVLIRLPEHGLAHLVLARIERRNRDFINAKNRLSALGKNKAEDVSDITAAIQTELGLTLDRIGEHHTAYEAFKRANNIMAELPVATTINPHATFKLIENYQTWLSTREKMTPIPSKIDDEHPSPIFLVGFPRSGTTLTEQILAASPDVTTADELTTLHEIASTLTETLSRQFSYPQDLDTLTQEEIHTLRQRYWTITSNAMGEIISNTRFVDKMPLNLIHLGLVENIFPKSKIIVALRDPRDVCLSCFMQLFQLNESMIQFLAMDSTSKYYSAVMGLWLSYRENTQLSWTESRYEDIVEDTETNTIKLMNFLGLNADDNASDNAKTFHHQASKRIISTPSYQDVGTPIYQRARGRWENYQDVMQESLITLTPYVQTFGYTSKV